MPATGGIAAPQSSSILQLSNQAYADLGNALPISFLGAAPYAFEGWFLFGGLCPDSTLIEKPGEFVLGTKGAAVYVQRTGQIFPLQTAAVLNTTDWFHIAVSFDGTTLSLYVNGLLDASTSSPGPGIAGQGQNFQLGATFQGQIDSFRIWNTRRTQSEIYTGQWLTLGPQAGLVSEYDFTQTPPRDLSGNNNPINLRSGAAMLTLTPAVRVISAGYCEPVDDAALVNPGGGGNDPYSIIAWVNLDITAGLQTIFGNGDLSLASGLFLSVNNGVVTAQRGGTGPTTLSSQATLGAGQWYCIAWTYDGTTQSLYINGVLDSAAPAAAIPTMARGDLTIAAAFSSQSAVALNSLQGYIQFISVWNICLPAAQIGQWMYHNPTDQTGVTADYSFAGDSATNLQTGNPIGLAAGASLVQVQTTPAAEAGPPPPPRPAIEARPAGRPLTAADVAERQAFYTPERRAAIIAEYARALPRHMPRGARAAAIAELAQRLEALAGPDPHAGDGAGARYRVEREGEQWSFRRTDADGDTELLRVAVADLTPCQAALVTYIVGVFDLFLGIVGLRFETSAATRFFNIRIGEGGFVTAMSAILSLPLSPSSILKIIAILWDFGWFTTAIQLLINGMTWWDWITLAARVASMIVPYPTFQKAYAVAQIAIGLWEVASAAALCDQYCLRPHGTAESAVCEI